MRGEAGFTSFLFQKNSYKSLLKEGGFLTRPSFLNFFPYKNHILSNNKNLLELFKIGPFYTAWFLIIAINKDCLSRKEDIEMKKLIY